MPVAVELPELQETARTRFGVTLTRRQLEAFAWYARELVEWNDRSNLTAITDPAEIEVKHFVDSVSCVLAMRPQPTGRLADIGAGAGVPGLPLKIAFPRLQVTLIEATGKKAEFCRHVVEALELEGVEVIHGRAEEVGHLAGHRQAYDWATARAVAQLPVVVEYLLPLLKLGGKAIAQKGETGPAEAHAAEPALRMLGGRMAQIIPVELPRVPETRYLVVMDKVAATPAGYPRRPGVPLKRPLE